MTGATAPSEPEFVVRRQDDHGNVFDVAVHATREAAQEQADALEARGHKQTYWVAERPAPPPA